MPSQKPPQSMTEPKNLIGKRLKLLREQNRLSQEALAKKLQLSGVDIDKNIITRMETNKRSVKDFELKALAEVFHVSYKCLIDGDEDY